MSHPQDVFPPVMPVEGKTFSLFGKSQTTHGYYDLIRNLADDILLKYGKEETVLELIRRYSKKKHLLRKISNGSKNPEPISQIIRILNRSLSDYTLNVEAHLQSLSILKFRDRRLYTSREQHHLYMLEAELTNRLYRDEFKKATKKIALLPHCLRDLTVNCKSAPDEFDYQCKKCSKNCFLNHSGQILQENNIDAYIWRTADIKKKLKEAIQTNHTFGILGIACIPELVSGMRMCVKYGIPVVGIPLDANRCIRWMGDFYPNSINLEQLEKLIT